MDLSQAMLGQEIVRLLAAFFFGALIGAEREVHHKAAGFRTIILISVGSALFTIISVSVGGEPGRIAAQIVTGVGFIGAGVIIHEGGNVRGLTTASTIWLAAAAGMGAGAGLLLISGAATAMALLVLAGMPRLEAALRTRRNLNEFSVVTPMDPMIRERLERRMAALGLRCDLVSLEKKEHTFGYTWVAVGPQVAQDQLMNALLADPEVLELRG